MNSKRIPIEVRAVTRKAVYHRREASCITSEPATLTSKASSLSLGRLFEVALRSPINRLRFALYCAFLLLFSTSVVQRAAAQQFTEPITSPSSKLYPRSVVSGDFDGDGKMDLVAGGLLLLGKGDGTFKPPLPSPAGNEYYVIASDFNRDGVLDIATAPQFANVAVSLGKGDGSFQLPGITDNRIVGSPVAMAAGDFNKDGKLDLAVTDYSGTTSVSVRLGKGDGTFKLFGHLGTDNNASAVAVADFNGDGNLDVACYTYTSTYKLSVFLGNGNGTFQAATKLPWRLGDISSMAVGDFNRDGIADLAIVHGSGNGGNSVGVLPGKGDGTFVTEQSYAVGNYPTGVAVGDFDGNGAPDLVVTNRDEGTVSVLFNKRHH